MTVTYTTVASGCADGAADRAPSPAPPRQRMSSSERREQLLDVTRELAWERGFHAVSIDAVARAAGISRPDRLRALRRPLGPAELPSSSARRERAAGPARRPPPHRARRRPARATPRRARRLPRGGRGRADPLAADPDAARGRARDPARAVRARALGRHRPARRRRRARPAAVRRATPSPDAELLARSLQALGRGARPRCCSPTPSATRASALLDYAGWALRLFAIGPG